MPSTKKESPTVRAKTFLKKKHLICFILFQFVIIATVSGYLWTALHLQPLPTVSGNSSGISAEVMVVRSEDYQLTKPFRLVENGSESAGFQQLKTSLAQLIEQSRQAGKITTASVYFRDLSKEGWISINEDEKYRPGSISKIPILIYFLKKAEENQAFLNTMYTYSNPIADPKKETYQEETMVVGQRYSVKELLYKMIVHSDNIATTILLMHLDEPEKYRKIYSDLHIRPPQPHDAGFSLSARECSRFLRVLYNATYLTPKYSEYALNLLSKSSFKEGLKKGLPPDLIVAGKFGEAGEESRPEFSETAIVYDQDKPYLLTVMTKGNDVRQQTEVFSEISRVVFDR